jgi:tetratricopeptide (TPR) repeat protein
MLKLKIKNMFDENRGLAGEIAKKIGLSNATPLYKFVNDPDREMDNFNCLLTLVREMFDDEKKIMTEYIKTIDPNKSIARICLEYTQLNKMYDLHRELLEKMKSCKNAESREWACIYDIDYKFTIKQTTASETITSVTVCNPKKTEMKTYATLLKAYCYYEMDCKPLLEESVRICRLLIPKIKNEYVRNCYISRLALLASVSYFNDGNAQAARTYAKFGLEIDCPPSIKRWIYLSMGNSYMLEDYDLSMQYLHKSLEISLENKFEDSEQEAKKSINFLNILSNNKPQYEIKDCVARNHQKAFWEHKQGLNELSETTLKLMDQDMMNDTQMAFHTYYLGLALNSRSHMLISIRQFKKCRSTFFIQLPANELKRMGECEEVVKTLIA